MPNFKIEFSRTWTEFDSSCPDDTVTSKNGTAGDWGWDDIAETDEEADDGQDPQDH